MPLISAHALTVDVFERGSGAPALFLHSAGTGASQWRPLIEALAGRRRCLAVNQRGYGRTSPWVAGVAASPERELDVVDAALAHVGAPVDLVGHSMGAWYALQAAARDPSRFRTVALIEPVALGLLRADGGGSALAEVEAMVGDALGFLAAGDVNAAMARFTDYWYGAGAWAKIPLAQRLPVFARAEKMRSDLMAVQADRDALAVCRTIDRATLVLSAGRTTPAARRMAELIAGLVPGARHETLAEAGHMLPVTHAAALGAILEDFWRGDGRG